MRMVMIGVVAFPLLGGCTWGQTRVDDCERLAASGAPIEVEALAQASGTPTVRLTHQLCSAHVDRLGGLPGVRHEEAGWCASIPETVPATATAVRASVGRQCLAAVERRVAYAAWHSSVAGMFVYAAPRGYRVSPLIPIRTPRYPDPPPLPIDPDRR